MAGLDEINIFEGHENEMCQISDGYTDDRIGEVLDPKLNTAARRKEINTMEMMGVYRKVPRQLATVRQQKVVGVR